MASPTASWNVCKWPLRRKLRALWLVIVAAIFCTLPMLLIEMQKHDWDNIYKGAPCAAQSCASKPPAAHTSLRTCAPLPATRTACSPARGRSPAVTREGCQLAPLCRAAWFLAGLSCVLTWTVTLYEVALHLEYFSCPPLQRHIVRILLMPPIYALDAWFCLRFTEARISLTPIREAYEAYTIYNFFMCAHHHHPGLPLAPMHYDTIAHRSPASRRRDHVLEAGRAGPGRGDVQRSRAHRYLNRYLEAQLGPVPEYMAERATTVPHIWPVNYFSSPWAGRELFRRCRSGVLNYVILRPATACVMWLTLVTSHGRYEEGAPRRLAIARRAECG